MHSLILPYEIALSLIFLLSFLGHPLLPDFFLDVDPETLAMKMEAQGKNLLGYVTFPEILKYAAKSFLELLSLSNIWEKLIDCSFSAHSYICV